MKSIKITFTGFNIKAMYTYSKCINNYNPVMEYTVFWNVPFCIISTFTFGTLSRLYFHVNGFVLLSKVK